MKIILKQDLPKIGRKNDITDVSNGYARNFLIPKGLAVPATMQSEATLKDLEAKQAERQARILQGFAHLRETLSGKEVTLKAETTDKGTLYASITKEAILEAILALHADAVIDTTMLQFEPIKEIGSHEITISHGEDSFTMNAVIEQV